MGQISLSWNLMCYAQKFLAIRAANMSWCFTWIPAKRAWRLWTPKPQNFEAVFQNFPRCFVHKKLRPVHSEDPLRPPESTCCCFRLLFPSPKCFFNLRGEPVLFCGSGTPSKSEQSNIASASIYISIRCQSTNSSPPIRSLPSAVLPHVRRLRVPVPS